MLNFTGAGTSFYTEKPIALSIFSCSVSSQLRLCQSIWMSRREQFSNGETVENFIWSQNLSFTTYKCTFYFSVWLVFLWKRWSNSQLQTLQHMFCVNFVLVILWGGQGESSSQMVSLYSFKLLFGPKIIHWRQTHVFMFCLTYASLQKVLCSRVAKAPTNVPNKPN